MWPSQSGILVCAKSPISISQAVLGIQRDGGNQKWHELTKTEGRQSIAKTFHGCLYLVTKPLSTCQTQPHVAPASDSVSLSSLVLGDQGRWCHQGDGEAAQGEKILTLFIFFHLFLLVGG